MTCKYCRSDEFPLDFNFCPICGHGMYIINAKRKLAKLAEDLIERDSKKTGEAIDMLSKLSKIALIKVLTGCDLHEYTYDENGNLMEVEREPFDIKDNSFDGQPINSFDWENVDITREMIWLEADSIINGGNDEREEE